jgi:hypothetical protein
MTSTVDVPPAARLAVLGAGLFGATGSLRVDQIAIAAAVHNRTGTGIRPATDRRRGPGVD